MSVTKWQADVFGVLVTAVETAGPHDLFIAEEGSVSLCVCVENHCFFCITSMSYWTIGCFTKPTLLSPLVWVERQKQDVCECVTVGDGTNKRCFFSVCYMHVCSPVQELTNSVDYPNFTVCWCVCVCVLLGMTEQVLRPCQGRGYSTARGAGTDTSLWPHSSPRGQLGTACNPSASPSTLLSPLLLSA